MTLFIWIPRYRFLQGPNGKHVEGRFLGSRSLVNNSEFTFIVHSPALRALHLLASSLPCTFASITFMNLLKYLCILPGELERMCVAHWIGFVHCVLVTYGYDLVYSVITQCSNIVRFRFDSFGLILLIFLFLDLSLSSKPNEVAVSSIPSSLSSASNS